MKTHLCCLVPLFFCACATGPANYQINVGNGHSGLPVREVRLEADGREAEYAVIAPQKVAASKPRKGELPREVTVSWRGTDGTSHRKSIPVAGKVRQDFKGQLALEITPDNQLTLTEVPSTGKEISTMPWAIPEAWEGSISMPGME